MKISYIIVCLIGLAVAARAQSFAQSPSKAVASPPDSSAATAICPIVYPLDENPSAHGYQYAFHGNAFFINRDGLLITAAHVLHSFRNGGDPYILVQRVEAPPQNVEGGSRAGRSRA